LIPRKEERAVLVTVESEVGSAVYFHVTKHSILLFALGITEKDLGWSQQKTPHASPDIANYLMLSVVCC